MKKNPVAFIYGMILPVIAGLLTVLYYRIFAYPTFYSAIPEIAKITFRSYYTALLFSFVGAVGIAIFGLLVIGLAWRYYWQFNWFAQLSLLTIFYMLPYIYLGWASMIVAGIIIVVSIILTYLFNLFVLSKHNKTWSLMR